MSSAENILLGNENLSPRAQLLPFKLLEKIARLPDPLISLATGKSNLAYVDRLPQIEAIKGIVQAVVAEWQPFSTDIELPTGDGIREVMILGINDFFNYTQDIGIVTHEMVELLGKLSAVSNITVSSGGEVVGKVIGFDKIRKSFPDDAGEEGARIQVSPEIMRHFTRRYLEIAKNKGIEIDPLVLRNAVIASIAVHERSHLLEGALQTQLLSLVADDPKFNYLRAFVSSGDLTFLPAQEIVEKTIPEVDVFCEGAIHGERLATGFELFSLDFFLQQAKVPDEVRNSLMDAILEDRSERLKGYRELLPKLFARGMSELEIRTLITDVESLCRDLVEPGVVDGICFSGGFQFWKGIGYAHPYTAHELQQILARSYNDLTVDKARKLLM